MAYGNEGNESISFLVKISINESEDFKKYVVEGKDVADTSKFKGKGVREDFYSNEGRVRFWTFSKNLGIKEGNKVAFLVDTTLYLFESSRVIKDEDIAKILDYPNREERPFIVLLKPLKPPIYRQKLSDSSIREILKKCKEIEKDIFKCEIALSDIEKPSLEEYLRSRRYVFPDYLIAQFYTALKTKGFVILSGLSGTGKTKIALDFVKLLERRFILESKEIEKLDEFMTSSGSNFKPEDEIKKLKETKKRNGFAVKYFNYKGELAKSKPPIVLWIYNAIEGTNTYQKVVMGLLITDIKEYSYDTLPEEWKKGLEWMKDVYGTNLKSELSDSKLCVKIEDVWEEEVDITKFRDKDTGARLSTKDASRIGGGRFIRVKSPEGLIPLERNYTFLSVRPDWRDSKHLLGYYNPLDKKYYATPLLNLILRAERDYRERKNDALPYFIILDEMNLARVEYYFADLLSVLESGREDDGFTREPIRLHNVDEVERDQDIPKEIRLPPNIYIIGTVNIDETTYMFSPKVLDRAFVIEFHDVDMDNYPPPEQNIDHSDLRERILRDLRGKDGKFLVYSDKGIIIEAINELRDKGYWTILQELNKALEPFDLHFGYRVVDEIALFFKNAKESMDKNIIHFKNYDEIFDLAILMKILPKFYGNKRKLEKPLLLTLKIAKKGHLTGDETEKRNEDLLKDVLDKTSDEKMSVSDLIVKELKSLEKYRFKHTAKKILRMLRQLYDTGFASFS